LIRGCGAYRARSSPKLRSRFAFVKEFFEQLAQHGTTVGGAAAQVALRSTERLDLTQQAAERGFVPRLVQRESRERGSGQRCGRDASEAYPQPNHPALRVERQREGSRDGRDVVEHALTDLVE